MGKRWPMPLPLPLAPHHAPSFSQALEEALNHGLWSREGGTWALGMNDKARAGKPVSLHLSCLHQSPDLASKAFLEPKGLCGLLVRSRWLLVLWCSECGGVCLLWIFPRPSLTPQRAAPFQLRDLEGTPFMASHHHP